MAAKGYTIRPAARPDARAVARMWALMAEEHKAYDPDFWFWDKDAAKKWRLRFEEFLQQDSMVTLVAEDSSGKLAGFVVASAGDSGPVFARPRGAVWDLVVVGRHRGKGVGTQLAEAAFDALRAHGVEEVTLHVALANPAAIRFYEKVGMRPVMYRMFKRL